MFTKRRVANYFSFALALTLLLALPALAAPDRGVSAQTRERAGGKRVALVIGNGAYKTGRLKNPVNDARAMARVLERLGFQVTKGEDLSLSQMRRSIDRFGLHLRGAEVGLFYYAGHGIQVEGRNYLIPVDALLRDKPDVEYEAVKAGRVLAKMQSAQTRLNLVLLDACRNNPFARSFRNAVSQGLAYMDAPSGSVIAYATAPGSVAADGRGDNSPFAAALSRHLGQPGVSVDRALKRTGAEVHRETNGKQEPWISTNYYGEYFLAGGAASPSVQLAGGPGPAVDQRKENVARLLRQAEADLAAGRLTTPPGNNAYERYQRVLSLEPYNATANQGLKRIVGRYVDLAKGRVKAGDLTRAEAYLARAEKISEADDRVLTLRDRMRKAQADGAQAEAEQKRTAGKQVREGAEHRRRAAEEAKAEAARRESERRLQQKSKRFTKDSNGVIVDHETGKEWYFDPVKLLTWYEAEKWVTHLSVGGGGWRMPTMIELGSLLIHNKNDLNLSPLFQTTRWRSVGYGMVWSKDMDYAGRAWIMIFPRIRKMAYSRAFKYWAFAVRTGNGGWRAEIKPARKDRATPNKSEWQVE